MNGCDLVSALRESSGVENDNHLCPVDAPEPMVDDLEATRVRAFANNLLSDKMAGFAKPRKRKPFIGPIHLAVANRRTRRAA